MTQKAPPQNPWTFDVRVRERNLRSGSLTEKDLEKHLSGLPDLEGQTESFAIAQPALEEPEGDDDDDAEDDDVVDGEPNA